VAIEVLGRQLANAGGPDALLSLCPWLEFVTIPTKAGWARLLRCPVRCGHAAAKLGFMGWFVAVVRLLGNAVQPPEAASLRCSLA
jgi:hypothetical protein